MPGHPSPLLESVLSRLLPVAVRDEVLGDLYERYQSPLQYLLAGVAIVPIAVFCRIRRTADPQVTLTVACLLYLCYLGTAWFTTPTSSTRLALPPALTLLGIVLADVYARRPGTIGAPAVGTALALAAELAVPAALPWALVAPAAAAGLVFASATRSLLVAAPSRRTVVQTSTPAGVAEPQRGHIFGVLLAIALMIVWAILRK